jgi:Reverse transcriptase (RNA-dependent DNA polymerase)
MDFLVLWMKRLTELQVLHQAYPGCRNCLLYADDTLIFLKPNVQQVRILKLIFQIFEKLSGLKVNMQKSEILITSSHSYQVQQLAQIMQCKAKDFSLKYLGLPLSDKPLTRQNYQMLIDAISERLPG